MAQGINVHHHIDRLAADLAAIPPRAAKELSGVVREGIRVGNSLARDFARESAGKHGRRYPSAFSAEMRKPYLSPVANVYQGEYGPDISKPQGGMSFEFGSRNQKPHLDLSRSADIIGPAFAKEVGDVIDRLFD